MLSLSYAEVLFNLNKKLFNIEFYNNFHSFLLLEQYKLYL